MDCSSSEKDEYFWILHFVLILSLPVYIVAIIALLQTKSTYFETYKLFLIWHTLGNLLAEILNSWFLVPVVHLPLPLLRFTGFLSQWGFSGLFQFLIIVSMIYQTAYSVFEMFMFRFRASMLDYKSCRFYIYLKIKTYIFRIVLIGFIVANCITYHIGLEQQHIIRQNLSNRYPESSILVICPNVIVAAPFEDPISLYNMIIWLFVVIITITSTTSTTIYLSRNLKENSHQSAAVVRMHNMLLITLSIQTAIHGIMLGIPNSLFIFAAFFGVRHESVAKISFIFLTFHGFASTLAMILLTKPIKLTVLQILKCKFSEKSVENPRRLSNKL
ncbi:hypothetical protein L5515_008905 [Caenorhabditis briggsae]|uniref:Uncharacterized protein n=2 Tax=Caenorhabditis briggsae TaxID=6238 RepID=A0AAE9F8G3_CAEBR|nr:hypothetical protein L5515_008905 [Caenorhabditis briggsae]